MAQGQTGSIIAFAQRKINDGAYKGIDLRRSIIGPNQAWLAIPSNREQDRILILTDEWKGFKDCYPGRNGSFFVNGAPGEGIGKYIILENNGVRHIFHNINGEQHSKNVMYVLNHGFDGKEPLIDSIRDCSGKEMHYFFTAEGEKYVFALDLPEKYDGTGVSLSKNILGGNLDMLIDTSISLMDRYSFWWHPERKVYLSNEANFGFFARYYFEYGKHFLYADKKPWDLLGLVVQSSE